MTEKYYLHNTSRYFILKSKINNDEKEKRNLEKHNNSSDESDRSDAARNFLKL
tara:strand:+ start:503 stop:661 length:159 start_codon:yes stop_codon:yes gene_type:complete